MIKKATKELDVLSKQLVVQSKSLDEIVKLAKDKEEMLASIPAIQPVANRDLKRMALVMGTEFIPYTKQESFMVEWIFLHRKELQYMLQGMEKFSKLFDLEKAWEIM